MIDAIRTGLMMASNCKIDLIQLLQQIQTNPRGLLSEVSEISVKTVLYKEVPNKLQKLHVGECLKYQPPSHLMSDQQSYRNTICTVKPEWSTAPDSIFQTILGKHKEIL